MEINFEQRVSALPSLGMGISTEFGAGKTGVDLEALWEASPGLCQFLEIGTDLERVFDADTLAWIKAGRPTTYHFLDLNLEAVVELAPRWADRCSRLARKWGAAWICGDAGLWHVGQKDRGHGTLMPPILVEESARLIAKNVRALRQISGLEVLPENPPAHVFAGEMDLLSYFAKILELADSGMVLDVAHLAIYQHVSGRAPLEGLDLFPMERIVEMHVAGGTLFDHEGLEFIDDSHGTQVLPATWEIFDHVLARASNLKAVVLEAERNSLDEVLTLFHELDGRWNQQGGSA